MILFKTITPLQKWVQKIKARNCKTGFVPTMGALHRGHLSLIEESKKQCDITVCSVFINPMQFNDPKDFEKYPVTIENDIFLLETNKADALFWPVVNEMYPQGFAARHFELGYLENILEGFYRLGHFQGVCNIVYSLLDIIHPDKVFLGKKDYQQCVIIKKAMREFFPDVAFITGEIVREPDGLAMSSRNMRLADQSRNNATGIFEALQFVGKNIANTNFAVLKQEAVQIMLNKGFDKVDYIEICDAETLLPVDEFDGRKKMIVLAAAFIDGVRLIDNVIIP